MKEYELVLGLEIHMHLKLDSKMFCFCDANIYGKEPNTHVCPVCLGLPGALPIPNKKAIEYTQLLGLALNCSLNKVSKFDRKNYFYPDLPKGYQISQYDLPFCYDGFLELKNKRIRIKRVHLEEDTGKSLHEGRETLLDFNKSGMALVEIVTEPDFHDIHEAVEFSKMIQKIVRTLGVSDCDMEKGQMRIEANISVREKGLSELPNYRVEVKNINSFKFLEKAVNYEFERQSKILEKGETVVQENRGFDDKKGITISQRQKEEESEYRYFPEPDIPPFEFSEEYVDELKGKIPELPNKKIERYINDLGLSESSAEILTETPEISLKFEEVAKVTNAKDASNILVNKLEFREKSVSEIIDYIKKTNSKEFLNETETLKIVEGILEENEKAVEDFKKGNENSVMFLLGACMKKGQGKIDAQKTKALIISILKS